jgi:hypothetical protein
MCPSGMRGGRAAPAARRGRARESQQRWRGRWEEPPSDTSNERERRWAVELRENGWRGWRGRRREETEELGLEEEDED